MGGFVLAVVRNSQTEIQGFIMKNLLFGFRVRHELSFAVMPPRTKSNTEFGFGT
jgi:hypothetical protein